MLKNGKNRIFLTCLMFLFIAELLDSCSGCSKSGLISIKNENRTVLTDSLNDNRSNPATPAGDTIIYPVRKK